MTMEELIALRLKVVRPPEGDKKSSLAERFLLPPFSVLDARRGQWQDRKRDWIALGIQSELGRGGNGDPESNGLLGISEGARSHYRITASSSGSAAPTGRAFPAMQAQRGADVGTPNEKYARGDGRGRALGQTFGSGKPNTLYNAYAQDDDVSRRIAEVQPQSGTSIFDPVLCELAYRWFCPQGGHVLDPFAGGSVRGVVAACLGRAYSGVDLRAEQIEANWPQADAICGPDHKIRWAAGDALNIQTLWPGEYDFIFSCPPYFDLERYSDDPRDLSTMEYEDFLDKYRRIIAASCAMLKPDRFACFVVGDVRDRRSGNYRNFPADTVDAFRAAGLELYNEAVLVTAVGSLPIRVGRQFAGYRKLGRTHQDVLIFLKGDAGRASMACGDVDVDDLEMPPCEEGAIAVCMQDMYNLPSAYHLGGDGSEVWSLDHLLITEACMLCDVLRHEARMRDANSPTPRIWVGTSDGWKRVPDTCMMSSIVGGRPYANPTLFPKAPKAPARPPVFKKIGEA